MGDWSMYLNLSIGLRMSLVVCEPYRQVYSGMILIDCMQSEGVLGFVYKH